MPVERGQIRVNAGKGCILAPPGEYDGRGFASAVRAVATTVNPSIAVSLVLSRFLVKTAASPGLSSWLLITALRTMRTEQISRSGAIQDSTIATWRAWHDRSIAGWLLITWWATSLCSLWWAWHGASRGSICVFTVWTTCSVVSRAIL